MDSQVVEYAEAAFARAAQRHGLLRFRRKGSLRGRTPSPAEWRERLGNVLNDDLSHQPEFLGIEGVEIAGHSLVVAFGICMHGGWHPFNLHPFALVEGTTNDGPLMTDLLVGLRDRGLIVTDALAFILTDCTEVLEAAVDSVFVNPIVAWDIQLKEERIRRRFRPHWERRGAVEE